MYVRRLIYVYIATYFCQEPASWCVDGSPFSYLFSFFPLPSSIPWPAPSFWPSTLLSLPTFLPICPVYSSFILLPLSPPTYSICCPLPLSPTLITLPLSSPSLPPPLSLDIQWSRYSEFQYPGSHETHYFPCTSESRRGVPLCGERWE